VQRLRSETAERLRAACAHFSEADFERLVTDVVATRLKFDRIDSLPNGVQRLE
jgi:hypothetical protein